MSFLNDLNDLLDPTKPRDEEIDETSAVVTEKSLAETDKVEKQGKSVLKAGADQLDIEKKYAGDIVKIGGDNDDESEIEDDLDEEGNLLDATDAMNAMNYTDEDEEDTESDEMDENDGSDESDLLSMGEESESEQEPDIKMFKSSSKSNLRSSIIKQQMAVVDSLYNCRIQLQKLLNSDLSQYKPEEILSLQNKFSQVQEQLDGIWEMDDMDVIGKCFERCKLFSGAFNQLETSPVDQISSILLDKSRLVKRTQRDRKAESADAYDIETFDDSDFYQELLKQVIMSKNYSPDTTDPTEITRNWLKLQETRKKKRSREVTDYHQRKGKKLNYKVHKKLVNFSQVDEKSMPSYTHEARNALFCSLFQ